MIEVTVSMLKAALIAAPKKDVRFNLVGVYFDPAGYMVSTNGHIMLCQKIKTFEGEGFIVPRQSVDLAIKGQKYDVTITRDTIGNVKYSPVDGTFPNWRAVFPRTFSGEFCGFDPYLVSDLKKIQETLTGRDSRFSTSDIATNGQAAGLACLAFDVFAVIMPTYGAEKMDFAHEVSGFLVDQQAQLKEAA